MNTRQAQPGGVLVFPTLPRHLNSNPDIPTYATSALRRISPASDPVRLVDMSEVAGIIAREKPRVALGIGSVAHAADYTVLHQTARRAGTTLAYWLHDEPYEFDFAWRVLDRCDALFVNDSSAIDFYDRAHVTHLPLAASLDHHFRPPTHLRERLHDVFFCGYGYANRRELIVRLRRILAGVDTRILGAEWPDGLAFCANRRLSGGGIVEGYATARLTLNIGRHDNLANRRFDLVSSTPGPRTFEAAAAGALQASFLEGLEIADYYDLGTEILTFDGVSGFEALLDDVLARPDHYDAVVAAAQARTRAEHTYDHRMRTLLSRLNTTRREAA